MAADESAILESSSYAHSNQLTSLRSSCFEPSAQAAKCGPCPGLSSAMRMMQLDDYEIKPSELEIMVNLDGSPHVLGRGAFGQVHAFPLIHKAWRSTDCHFHEA